jgi:hypothetical protein
METELSGVVMQMRISAKYNTCRHPRRWPRTQGDNGTRHAKSNLKFNYRVPMERGNDPIEIKEQAGFR